MAQPALAATPPAVAQNTTPPAPTTTAPPAVPTPTTTAAPPVAPATTQTPPSAPTASAAESKEPPPEENPTVQAVELSKLCSIYQGQKKNPNKCTGSATLLYRKNLLHQHGPVDVLLFLHGHDPQEVNVNGKVRRLKEPRYKFDRLAEQLGKINTDRLVILMPQGSLLAEFSNQIDQQPQFPEAGFPVRPFLIEALSRARKLVQQFPKARLGKLILAGHSGGARTILGLLQDPKKWDLNPQKLALVILLDGINDTEKELPFVQQLIFCRSRTNRATCNIDPYQKQPPHFLLDLHVSNYPSYIATHKLLAWPDKKRRAPSARLILHTVGHSLLAREGALAQSLLRLYPSTPTPPPPSKGPALPPTSPTSPQPPPRVSYTSGQTK